MKKKILNVLLIMGILFSSFSPIAVHGATYTDYVSEDGEFISGIYITRTDPARPTWRSWQQAKFIRRASDWMWMYCIQPGVPIDDKLQYNGTDRDWATYANMTQSQWDKIALLSYYGYGHNENGYNHTDSKWYAITQLMIWQVAEPTWDIYWTDTLDGNKITRFTTEMAELNQLVNNHYAVPSFQNSDQKITVGTSLTLTDTNNVLSQFNVSSNSLVNTSVSGNQLTITPNEVGNTTLTLTKSTNKWKTPPLLYVHPESQNVMVVGDYDPITTKINIEVIGGKVTINKKDIDLSQAIPQGEATLGGAIYGVFTDTNIRVGTITTDATGKATSDYLPSLGRFYVQEMTPSTGYLLDSTKYYFNITESDLYPDIDVYEKVITRDVEIIKTLSNGGITGEMTPEINIRFGFFNKNGDLYKEATTDSKGYLKVTLPYGTYTVKQLNTTPNYEKVKDFKIEVRDVGNSYTYYLSNADTQAKLKVIKIDLDTGEIIERSNIKFKIFDINRNEYVRQVITYPTNQILEVFETDENGVLTTPYPLSSGRYRLEEVDQVLDGYLWNNESLYFEITDSTDFIYDDIYGTMLEVKFSNKEVKGKLEIIKNGEDVVIEDGTYKYINIKLENVKFNVYASEDIYSANGKIIHIKDSLVATITTDENGYAELENLHLGSYYLKEIESSNNNAINDEIYEFTLTYKDQYTEIIINSTTRDNKYITGKLEFTKTDLTTGKVIPNTVIEIYTENDELIFTGITDKNGKITITDLFIGKFYIIEKEPTTGYRINDEKVYFEITEDGEIIKANMTNEKIKGHLQLSKIDIETGEAIPNTEIEIFNEFDELVFSGITDENGLITIELEYGRYYILEKNPATGYLNTNEKIYFDILEDGSVIEIVMTNEKIPVPNTGIDMVDISYILGAFALLGGIGALIYENKRKKK